MSKKYSILLVVLVIAITISLFLITKPLFREKTNGEIVQQELYRYEQDLKIGNNKIENNYKKEAHNILSEYLEKEELSKEDVEKTRNDLLQLIVNKDLQSLHFSLIYAMNKMEEYLDNNDERDRITSMNVIKQMQSDHDWLN